MRHVDLSSLTRRVCVNPHPLSWKAKSSPLGHRGSLSSLTCLWSSLPFTSGVCSVQLWFHLSSCFFFPHCAALTWQGTGEASLEAWRPLWGVSLGLTSRLALTCCWEKGSLFRLCSSSQRGPACFPFQDAHWQCGGSFLRASHQIDALLLPPSWSAYVDANALQTLWLLICP